MREQNIFCFQLKFSMESILSVVFLSRGSMSVDFVLSCNKNTKQTSKKNQRNKQQHTHTHKHTHKQTKQGKI